MKYNPDIHHRRSIRLRGYDYSCAGAYFVTICVEDRGASVFGDVLGGEMQLNEVGLIAQSAWEGLPCRFAGVALDEYLIMPNHVHGIILLSGTQFTAAGVARRVRGGVINHAPTSGGSVPPSRSTISPSSEPPGPIGRRVPPVGAQLIAPNAAGNSPEVALRGTPALGEIVRTFKAVTTRRIRVWGAPQFTWQRNYYEHIVRDDQSLERAREYIANNPIRWLLDELNPKNTDRARWATARSASGVGLEWRPT